MVNNALTAANRKLIVSRGLVMGILASLGLVYFFNNSLYLFVCLLTFYILLFLLWKPLRPGIVIFSVQLQWVQVFAYVLWMNSMDWDMDKLSNHGGIAVIMSCLGLIAMSATISLGIRNIAVPTMEQFHVQAKRINEKKVLLLYLFSTFILGSLGLIVGGQSGLLQIIWTIGSLKWVFFMVYGYVAWINKKNRLILVLIILFEFTSSLYSYFSNFKDVLFYTIILSLTFIRRINFKQFIYGILISAAVLMLMLTWTAIKGDYRNFLNQGRKQQVVEVSRSEAFSKIGEKLSSLTWDDYMNVTGLFLYRVQYILHLGKTMDRVPDLLPHEYGKVWWENISFVLMPRLFFPDKPIYEATVKTNKYTGFRYAGFKQGTSYSLGYFADSYIDFGYAGMFMPLVLIALYVVWIYRGLYGFQNINILFRYAIINTALINFTTFEADGLFLFGRLTLLGLVFWAFNKFVFRYIQDWLYKPSQK